MSKFKGLKRLSDDDFRRYVGVKRVTFDLMVKRLKEAEAEQKKYGGRPNDQRIEDRLLMTLEYFREYRTYFHVANSYGTSETSCIRNCRWVEGILVKCQEFRLPSQRVLHEADHQFEVVLIDATESPIQRPKKKGVQREESQKPQ